MLSKPTAKRLIGLKAQWRADDKGFTFSLTDDRGNTASVHFDNASPQKAARIEANRLNIEKNLKRQEAQISKSNHL